MPSPPPISRHFLRSSGVEYNKRGYQANGIDMVRPSTRSTVNVSSVTITSWAYASKYVSTAKVLIPLIEQLCLVILDNVLYSVNFFPTESIAMVKPDRLQPKFCSIIVALNMNMGWFATIPSIKEKSVRPNS